MRFHQTIVSLALAVTLGCHAQVPPPASGPALSPDLARRVEVMLRSRTKLPPDYTFAIGPRTHSDVAGYDTIAVIVTQQTESGPANQSHPLTFLLSKDGKTLAQFNTYDISARPAQRSSRAPAGRRAADRFHRPRADRRLRRPGVPVLHPHAYAAFPRPDRTLQGPGAHRLSRFPALDSPLGHARGRRYELRRRTIGRRVLGPGRLHSRARLGLRRP